MGLFSKKHTDGNHDLLTDFHFPTSKKAVIIFTRNPELGTCKTRLAKTVGDESALNIYNYLLNHTAKGASQVSADRYVFYSEEIMTDDIWDEKYFRKKLQFGHDLGAKMEHAFFELFQLGYEKVVIIGSDLLDLNAEHIETAFEYLNNNEVVMGPATDGGYYLLGLKTLYTDIFKNKEWGTDTVRAKTLNDLKEMKVGLLEELNDIDTFEDMQDYDELKKFYTTTHD